MGDTQAAEERIRREMQKIMQQKEARSAYGKEGEQAEGAQEEGEQEKGKSRSIGKGRKEKG